MASAAKQRRLTSVSLIVALAAAALIATKRFYADISTDDEPLVKSINLADIHRKSMHRDSSGGRGNTRDLPEDGGDDQSHHAEGAAIDEEGYPSSLDFDPFWDDEFGYSDVDDIYVRVAETSDDDTTTRVDSIANENGEAIASPACNPHFSAALPNNKWDNTTKFKRIYFYHARKAGGSSMHKYFVNVAQHYGLEFAYTEWSGMEEPGTYDAATFYVTILREPVDRSISHFKYQGRWSCKDLMSRAFEPTEDNANKIETWNHTGGHAPYTCKRRGGRKSGKEMFYLGSCAVNCYTQWYSGVCPESQSGITLEQQHQMAKARVSKFNLIVVMERLNDPHYIEAIENMFGVRGLTRKGHPYCEAPSHKANEETPLIVSQRTRERLRSLNHLDTDIYDSLTGCLDDSRGRYHFPKFDQDRFDLHTYNSTEAKLVRKQAKAAKLDAKKNGKVKKRLLV